MTRRLALTALTCVAIAGLLAAPIAAQAQKAPLSLASATVTIAGTSNVHDFTASTNDVRLTRIATADGVAGAAVLANPAALEAFEITIKAATLTSTRDGLDKNMYKALKTNEFPEIVFRLVKLEGTPAAMKAGGLLKIAGVEKNLALDLKAAVNGGSLTITGQVGLLMTDYGIAPPKAMLGALKTDPKITVKFETVFALPSTF